MEGLVRLSVKLQVEERSRLSGVTSSWFMGCISTCAIHYGSIFCELACCGYSMYAPRLINTAHESTPKLP
jgi:hypothetical protein